MAAYSLARDEGALRLTGEVTMEEAGSFWNELRAAANDADRLALDLSQVRSLDGNVAALITAARAELATKGVRLDIVHVPEHLRPLVDLYGGSHAPRRRKRRKPESTVAQVGNATARAMVELKGVLSFFGEMVLAVGGLVRHPRSGHWKEVPPLAERTGADAVPIVALINFLVGFVMAYQAANELRMFGANIYVADLVGLSITRELGPIMTAIVVCGRSGAAFAAEIGTMKVGEEVDALRTFGLRPFAWLVVPRVLALVLVVPLLTLVADVVGVAGGLFVGVTSLDLTTRGYLIETQKSVQVWDVEYGIIKSVAFALVIGLIACQQGFSTSGGAEGVGRRTTSTVVTCLFALVLLDAVFTIIYQAFNL